METINTARLFPLVMLLIFIVFLVVGVGYAWNYSCKAMPSIDGFQQNGGGLAREGGQKFPPTTPSNVMMAANPDAIMGTAEPGAPVGAPSVEGFWAGPARGAGVPDCMQTLADGARVYELLSKKSAGSTEEGPDDLRELALILSKLACFKRDLMGAAGVVEATRYQPFSTAHDMEPVAETTARCFAKTIPQRDLQLTLDKWGSRGTFLLKRLCTSEMLTEAEEEEALQAFGRAMADVGDVAMSVCCNATGVAKLAGENQPRMVGGYEPPGTAGLREYKGYY
jgi:hypothetical protein